METSEIILKDGTVRKYVITKNGIAYDHRTNEKVIQALDYAFITKKRVKLDYGEVETGKSWNEEYDTVGTIGKSTGKIKIPLLIRTKRSYGGGAILDRCIIKITDAKTKEILYKAPNYQEKEFKIVPCTIHAPEYNFSLLINGDLFSNHRTEKSAKLLIHKLS